MAALRSFWSFGRGVFEAVAVAALFVAGGLSYAAVLGGGALPAGEPALYLPPPMEPELPAASPRVWLVDGYNVLSVGLLAGRAREAWWTGPYRDELLGRAEAFEVDAEEIWVVFDGQMAEGRAQRGKAERRSNGIAERSSERWSVETSRVRSVFAPSADEWLLARIRERDPAQLALVTADRRLAARARSRGVTVVVPAAFLARCRAVSPA